MQSCSHGVFLVLAPLASLSLAGQEHGRTIPLADIESRGMSGASEGSVGIGWVRAVGKGYPAPSSKTSAGGTPLMASAPMSLARKPLLGSLPDIYCTGTSNRASKIAVEVLRRDGITRRFCSRPIRYECARFNFVDTSSRLHPPWKPSARLPARLLCFPHRPSDDCSMRT